MTTLMLMMINATKSDEISKVEAQMFRGAEDSGDRAGSGGAVRRRAGDVTVGERQRAWQAVGSFG